MFGFKLKEEGVLYVFVQDVRWGIEITANNDLVVHKMVSKWLIVYMLIVWGIHSALSAIIIKKREILQDDNS